MKKWIIKDFKDKKGSVHFFNVECVYPTINLNRQNYLEVDISTTDKCNLLCNYCIENCNINTNAAEMSINDFDAIIRLFNSFNIDYYSRVLLYGGECTTNKDLNYLIKQFDVNKYISPIIFSNRPLRYWLNKVLYIS